MLATDSPSVSDRTAVAESAREALSPSVAQLLSRAFGIEMSVVDGLTGELLVESPDQPARDWGTRAEVCRQVAEQGSAEFIEEADPLLVLALPILGLRDEQSRVAVATLVTRPIDADESLREAAEMLGLSTEEARAWIERQTVWPLDLLHRVIDLTMERLSVGRRNEALDREVRCLSSGLSSTYEEISLIYRLTQNLKLSASAEELGELALEGLEEVIPADALVLLMLPMAGEEGLLGQQGRSEELFLTRGDCPIDADDLKGMAEYLGLVAQCRPVVANPPVTEENDWPLPGVRQMVMVPLDEGENLFGWLAAINHHDGGEFGTVEANLINSVATILGIHSGNIDLYRKQSDMFAGVVRAMVSAIDAKDPYTRGHSDRVAQISVRLAEEMGCDHELITLIYMSGLLHDIGKIGIDDHVLRKPGRLTDEEYEHIKSHSTVGHRILKDLKKMDDILPVVLHHHESWGGGGYPDDLRGEKIPLMARIVAVADAFDAMSSDRPYRKGMPFEKIDAILRDGAGKQWDPKIIDAFFRARDAIRQISQQEREELANDFQLWG